MTPAEKPKDTERKVVLVFLASKAIKEPIPVANPAKAVSIKANIIDEVDRSSSIFSPNCYFAFCNSIVLNIYFSLF